MKILTNHIGYETALPKRAVLSGQASDQPTAFRLVDDRTGLTALTGTPIEAGPVKRWKDWHFWILDFSSLQTEGVYAIECDAALGTIRSEPFLIQDYVLERNALSNVVAYFKSMRCSGLFDKADRQMRFEGYDSGKLVDVHGGWYDATADYGKHLSHLCFSTYFNPQQLPMVAWSLLKSYEAISAKANPYF